MNAVFTILQAYSYRDFSDGKQSRAELVDYYVYLFFIAVVYLGCIICVICRNFRSDVSNWSVYYVYLNSFSRVIQLICHLKLKLRIMRHCICKQIWRKKDNNTVKKPRHVRVTVKVNRHVIWSVGSYFPKYPSGACAVDTCTPTLPYFFWSTTTPCTVFSLLWLYFSSI